MYLYKKWLSNPATPLNVDEFVDITKNPPNYRYIACLQRMSVGHRKPSNDTVKLSSVESPFMKGLKVTQRTEPRNVSGKSISLDAKPVTIGKDDSPLIIGTIRMGFGHHRIAYAACSWALSEFVNTPTTYFHDLLNVDSEEADLIKDTDAMYSKMSRITSNIGGPFEALWGKMMLKGDADMLRISGLTAVHLRPLFKDLPKDTPIVATHCYVALAAVACGFTNVVNLVIDNHPQWFVVVPGCLNLVQGPANYQSFLRMGVKAENVQMAGHWVPKDIVVNIPEDCARRSARAAAGFGGNVKKFNPRRILIPVGGAGAQRKFIIQFIRGLRPLIHEGKVQLFLNAGDHVHMKESFLQVLKEIEMDSKYDTVTTLAGVEEFQHNLLAGKEPTKNITLFAFEDYFPAVATTDILSRVTDILACKPSELAFYPVPKLMIRRVGGHEQYSAIRAAELGDGTLEAREVEDALNNINLMVNKKELLVHMNEMIIKHAISGVYDGCKNAVKIALEMASKDK